MSSLPISTASIAKMDPTLRPPDAATIEQLRHRKTHPMEIAEMVTAMKERGMPRSEIQNHLGMSRCHINNLVRLLHLPAEIQAMIRNDQLPLAKGRALAGLQELGLPENELHDVMRGLVAETTPSETCASFNRRIQDLKAARMGHPQFHHQHQRLAEIVQVERQVDRLMNKLKCPLGDDAAAVAEILQPLQNQIEDILKNSQCEDSGNERDQQDQETNPVGTGVQPADPVLGG